jgi:uncharacterized protein (TIGR02594 family)
MRWFFDKFNGERDVVVLPPMVPRKSFPVAPEPIWLREARQHVGVVERKARGQHNSQILEYFAVTGFSQIQDDETAWCAAFANYCLIATGFAGTQSLVAKSFLTWGKKVGKPRVGDLIVLHRSPRKGQPPNPSTWHGHVGFYVGETATHWKILGGNQSNGVRVSSYAKSIQGVGTLAGFRRPVTMANSRTARASVLGIASGGVAAASVPGATSEFLLALAPALEPIREYFPAIVLGLVVLSVVGHALALRARLDDLWTKGR